MKRYSLISFLLLALLVTNAQEKKSITMAQWQEDVKFFGDELVKKHKNAFHHVSKEEFEKDVEQLYNDVPSLKEYEIIVRLMQIAAKVGDGHTGVHLPSDFKRYPVRLFWYEDGLQVTATTEEYKELLGTRLIRIGNLSMDEINKKLFTIISQDENKWYYMSTAVAFLNIPEIIGGLGMVPDHN